LSKEEGFGKRERGGKGEKREGERDERWVSVSSAFVLAFVPQIGEKGEEKEKRKKGGGRGRKKKEKGGERGKTRIFLIRLHTLSLAASFCF